MKKKITAIALAAIISATTMTPLVSAMNFTDISGLNETQLTVLEDSVNKGIITGYEDNTVRPYGTLTRAEFAAMICRYMDYEIVGSSSFFDVGSHWASGYIQACVDKGAINGIGNNLFDPEASVTFNQATKIVSIVSGMTNGFDIDGLGGYPLAFLTIGQSGGLFADLTSGMTGTDYPLSRIDAIIMLNNAGERHNSGGSVNSNESVNAEYPTATTAPAENPDVAIDNPDGKEIMTTAEAKAYITSPVRLEFRTWTDEAKEKISSILFESFKGVITGEKAIDWHEISAKFRNEGYSRHIAELDNAARDILAKALRNFSNDGHENGKVIIFD